jgi:flagellar hook-basal body complex protein FliE
VIVNPELSRFELEPSERAIGMPPPGANGASFADALLDALGDAKQAEAFAQDTSMKFAAGDPSVGIHEAMIAAEKASISLRYAVTLKNKAIDAYRELMNTSV